MKSLYEWPEIWQIVDLGYVNSPKLRTRPGDVTEEEGSGIF